MFLIYICFTFPSVGLKRKKHDTNATGTFISCEQMYSGPRWTSDSWRLQERASSSIKRMFVEESSGHFDKRWGGAHRLWVYMFSSPKLVSQQGNGGAELKRIVMSSKIAGLMAGSFAFVNLFCSGIGQVFVCACAVVSGWVKADFASRLEAALWSTWVGERCTYNAFIKREYFKRRLDKKWLTSVSLGYYASNPLQ